MNTKSVTYIEPIIKDTPIRVAAYVRVSSNSEEQLVSFQSQYDYYSNYVSEIDNAELVEVYSDEGVTGTSIKKRYGFQRMIMDCELGKIDRIVTKSITRFARNFIETLKIARELKVVGVSILFEEENIDTAKMTSELELTMFASASEMESKTIAFNQRWGFRSRAKEGIYNQSHLPYGYYRENGIIKINEREAEIIRLLFDMYVIQDYSIYAIKNEFNKRKIGNKVWAQSTLVMMLENERYCGDMLLQKKYTTEEFPYHLVRNKGELPKYYVYDSFPAIISRDLYERAQIKLELNRRKLSDKQLEANSEYSYTSKIECMDCQSTFKRRLLRGNEYWACQKHLIDKEGCNVKQISKDELDDAFLQVLFRLKDHCYILHRYMNHAIDLAIDKETQKTLNNIDNQIKELEQEKETLASQCFNNKITMQEYQTRLNRNKYYKSELEIEKRKCLSKVQETVAVVQTKNMIILLESVDYIKQFDNEIFNALISKLSVSESQIHFILLNDLQISIERKRFNGNYS